MELSLYATLTHEEGTTCLYLVDKEMEAAILSGEGEPHFCQLPIVQRYLLKGYQPNFDWMVYGYNSDTSSYLQQEWSQFIVLHAGSLEQSSLWIRFHTDRAILEANISNLKRTMNVSVEYA